MCGTVRTTKMRDFRACRSQEVHGTLRKRRVMIRAKYGFCAQDKYGIRKYAGVNRQNRGRPWQLTDRAIPVLLCEVFSCKVFHFMRVRRVVGRL